MHSGGHLSVGGSKWQVGLALCWLLSAGSAARQPVLPTSCCCRESTITLLPPTQMKRGGGSISLGRSLWGGLYWLPTACHQKRGCCHHASYKLEEASSGKWQGREGEGVPGGAWTATTGAFSLKAPLYKWPCLSSFKKSGRWRMKALTKL